MKYTALALLALASLVSGNLHLVDFTISRDDTNEISASISSGDLLRVNLRENPSTGYAWRFQDPFKRNSSVFSIEMDDYVESYNPDAKSGMSGVRSLLLKGENAGSDDFELVLVRQWEVQDFVDTVDEHGQPIQMKDVPNAGYKKITINVSD